MKRVILSVVAVMVVALSILPSAAFGQLDQHDDESDGFGTVPFTLHSLLFFSPAGQVFTPTLNSLDYVSIRTQDFQDTNGVAAQLYLSILEPTPNQQTATQFMQNPTGGTVIAISPIVTLQAGFGQSTNLGAITTFNFSSAVPLTPGTPYAFEITLLTPGNWAVLDNAGSPPFYSNVTYYAGGGNGYLSGDANFAPEFDLYFQEGMTTEVPEPSTLLLAGAGVLGLLLTRRRR
jgi:uncharacterized membrane protein YbaN (DUF454 family)